MVLPEEKFIPVSERIIEETDKWEILILEERSTKFNDLLVMMNKKLHQGEGDKLVAL